MSRVNVFITEAKLKAIDEYCLANKLKRSNLFVGATLAYINKRGGVRCDYCGKDSIGKYRLTIYNMDLGEQTVEKQLCQFHYSTAKKEGEVESV